MYDTKDGMRVRPLLPGEKWTLPRAMRDRHGDIPVSLSDGMFKQMRKMLAEGYWPG
jgi:hypothetical protein